MSRVERLTNVISAMRKVRAKHEKQFEKGLKKGGLFIYRKSLEIVPVDQGNLRASGFIRVEGSGFMTEVVIGYTAFYAIYVHEDLELRHGTAYNEWYAQEIAAGILHSRGPNQQAKFLEQPVRTHRNQIVNLIVQEMKAG